jgi:hypothetical protein
MRDLALENFRANFSHLTRTPEWEIVKQSFLKQFVPFLIPVISVLRNYQIGDQISLCFIIFYLLRKTN